MGRPRSRDGKIAPATSFGTVRTFDAAGRPIDTPPRVLTADHSRDCTCGELGLWAPGETDTARVDRLCPACTAAKAERIALIDARGEREELLAREEWRTTNAMKSPIPSPQKEITMPPTTNTALATPDPDDKITNAVPAGVPISPEDWAAMPESERTEAIAVFAAEAQETVRDLAIEFPKISTPTGGGQQWLMPNGDSVKEFAGVVVAHFKARAYWPLDAPVSNNPPACSSFDGRYPVSGSGPTGATQCAACPYSQFGTGKEARGQACKERMNVFLLMEESDLPRHLSLPPTGIKPFSRYARSLIDQKPVTPLSAVTTIFGLEKKQGAGPLYSIVAPRAKLVMGPDGKWVPETLPYAEVRAVLAMRKQFQDAMSKRGITDAEAAEDTNGHDTVIDHDTGEVVVDGLRQDGKARREDAGF